MLNNVFPWLKNNLVPEATEWWRLWSARFLVVILTIDALALSPVVGMLLLLSRHPPPSAVAQF